MPAAAIHQCVAKILNKSLKKDENLFLLGNVAPDCWRNGKNFGNRNLSHFSIDFKSDDTSLRNEDFKKFYNQYSNNIENPFVIGYLTHLITDTYWRDNVTSRYESVINGKRALLKKDGTYYQNSEENMRMYFYNNECQLISLLTKKFNLDKLPTIENIDTFDNPIKEIDITGLNDTVNYINYINFKNWDEESEMYDLDEISNDIDKTANFVLETLNKLQQSSD